MKTLLFIVGLLLNILLCCFPFKKFAKEAPVIEPISDSEHVEPLDTGTTAFSYASLLKAQAASLANNRKD